MPWNYHHLGHRMQFLGDNAIRTISGNYRTIVAGQTANLTVAGDNDDVTVGKFSSVGVTGNNDAVHVLGGPAAVSVSGVGDQIISTNPDASTNVSISGDRATVRSAGSVSGTELGSYDHIHASTGSMIVSGFYNTTIYDGAGSIQGAQSIGGDFTVSAGTVIGGRGPTSIHMGNEFNGKADFATASIGAGPTSVELKLGDGDHFTVNGFKDQDRVILSQANPVQNFDLQLVDNPDGLTRDMLATWGSCGDWHSATVSHADSILAGGSISEAVTANRLNFGGALADWRPQA
jgi:hypothetical protein